MRGPLLPAPLGRRRNSGGARGLRGFIPVLPFPLFKKGGAGEESGVPVMEEPEPLELPVDGVLDLHTFRPGEVKDLLADYLAACREKGILHVRVVHGKGTGALRRTVHSLLSRLPEVASFRLAGEDAGGWGATLVELRPAGKIPARQKP